MRENSKNRNYKSLQFNKIFITGGAGYVGSALVPRLLERGHEVTVYDLFLYEDTLGDHPKLKKIRGDIRNRDLLLESAKMHDAFIHLACISNDPSFDLDPELGKSINYDAFFNVLDSAKLNNVKRLIYASSASVYGIKKEKNVNEEATLEPITDYAKYKAECEKILSEESGDMEYVILRPATLCGYAPRLRLDLSVNILTINALVNRKIKVFGGNQFRPNLNIKDMVRAYELALDSPEDIINKGVFNVGYQNLTIMQIANAVKEVLGDKSIEIEIVPTDDKRSYHINSDKIKRILGFKFKYGVEDAVKSLLNAFNDGLISDGLNNPFYHNIKRMKEVNLN